MRVDELLQHFLIVDGAVRLVKHELKTSPGQHTTTSLRAIAQTERVSFAGLSAALRAFQQSGEIGFAKGPNGSRRWRLNSPELSQSMRDGCENESRSGSVACGTG